MKSRAISGCVRNCLNVASWGVGVLFFFFICLALKMTPICYHCWLHGSL